MVLAARARASNPMVKTERQPRARRLRQAHPISLSGAPAGQNIDRSRGRLVGFFTPRWLNRGLLISFLFHTDVWYSLYRRRITMAKPAAPRATSEVTTTIRRIRGGRAGWVRKNVVMDQRKLDLARRALGVRTETEAIDQALDLVAFREELVRGFTAVRRSGGVGDVFEGRRRA